MAQAYVKSDRTTVLAGAAASWDIPESRNFMGFLFHVTGFTVGTAVNIQFSLDGTNFVTLETKAAAAAGIFFNIHFNAPPRGGVRVTSGVSVAAGDIYVSMTDNPYNNFRVQG